MKHIVLIGFMGAGKSTVGRALAAELGRELLDTDQMIEEKAGCRIIYFPFPHQIALLKPIEA